MKENGPTTLDHVWQSGRWLPALDTSHFGPDERTTADLVHRAVQFARLLTYYDANNRPHFPVADSTSEAVGAWEMFFRNDVSFLLAEIIAVDGDREFRLSQIPGVNVESMIKDNLRRIDAWHKRASELSAMSGEVNVENALRGTLDNAIKNELSHSIREKDLGALRSAEKLVLEATKLKDGSKNLLADAFPVKIVYSALNRITKKLAAQAQQYLAVSLEEKSDHPPHTALYLAFISLLQKSQADLNKLTERHLDFYYKKVLQLAPLDAVADRVHLTLELAPHVKNQTLLKGTKLVAGGGSVAQPSVFATDTDVEINAVRVTGFKAIRVTRARLGPGATPFNDVQRVLAFPVADSADGFGEQIDDPTLGWPPFGPAIRDESIDAGPGLDAEIGVAIAAPVLEMAGGTRKVELVLTFANSHGGSVADAIESYRRQIQAANEFYRKQAIADVIGFDRRQTQAAIEFYSKQAIADATEFDRRQTQAANEFYRKQAKAGCKPTLLNQEFDQYVSAAFSVYVTTATGFMEISGLDVNYSQASNNLLIFRFTIPADAPAVEAAGATVDLPSDKPMLKLLFNPRARVFGYSAFGNAQIESIKINVHVDGLRQLDVATDLGPVDPAKPFPPFGPLPVRGAGLFISCPELCRKTLGNMQINLDWRGLPQAPDDLASYYADYGLQTRNDSFRVATKVSDGLVWRSLTGKGVGETRAALDVPLFAEDKKNGGLSRRSAWTLDSGAVATSEADLQSSEGHALGSFKVELVAPRYGFGHRVYPDIVTKLALASIDKATGLIVRLANAVKDIGKVETEDKEKVAAVPKPPLLPVVTDVSVGYAASATTNNVARAGDITLYQLTAFGGMTPALNGQLIARTFDGDGILLIGLSGVETPQVVTLLFDMHVATAPRWLPESGSRKPNLEWGYLVGARWQKLPDENILLDDSRKLTRPGIVKLLLPDDFNRFNDSDSAPTWLALLVQGDVERYGRILSVTAQAVTATRDLTNHRAGLELQMPAGSSWKPATAIPAVAKVNQPFGSDSGRAAESTRDFRLRVSERLRHKNRAIHAADYSRMVLAEFPQIAEACCYRSEAGRIDVVVTPRRHTLGKVAPPVVALNLRYEIARWLGKFTSPCVRVIVRSPNYETIKVRAQIAASSDATSDVIATVEAAIDRIIAPWQFDLNAPLPIGRAILDVSSVVSHLEDLDMVDKVAGLSLVQKYIVRAGVNNSKLMGLKDTARCRSSDVSNSASLASTGRAILRSATPWSVFVPAQRHAISKLNRRRRGIGELRVASDLIVTDTQASDAYMKGKKTIPVHPTRAGIGNLAIGDDLIIVTGADAIPPSSQNDTLPNRIDRIFMSTSGLHNNDL